MMSPNNKYKVTEFVGLVNYYQGIFTIGSHFLQLLPKFTSDKIKYKWSNIEQKDFGGTKTIVTWNTLLSVTLILFAHSAIDN